MHSGGRRVLLARPRAIILSPHKFYNIGGQRAPSSGTVIRDTKRKLWTFSFTPGSRFRLLGATLSTSLLGDVYRRHGHRGFMNNSSAINCNLGGARFAWNRP